MIPKSQLTTGDMDRLVGKKQKRKLRWSRVEQERETIPATAVMDHLRLGN